MSITLKTYQEVESSENSMGKKVRFHKKRRKKGSCLDMSVDQRLVWLPSSGYILLGLQLNGVNHFLCRCFLNVPSHLFHRFYTITTQLFPPPTLFIKKSLNLGSFTDIQISGCCLAVVFLFCTL